MGDIFFLIRMTVITFIVVLLLQIKIGDHTLEEKTHFWIKSSPVLPYLQEVAEGAAIVVGETYQAIFGNIKTKFMTRLERKNQPGERSLGLVLQRSQKYLEKQTEKAKQAIDQYQYRQEQIDAVESLELKQDENWQDQYQTPVWDSETE